MIVKTRTTVDFHSNAADPEFAMGEFACLIDLDDARAILFDLSGSCVVVDHVASFMINAVLSTNFDRALQNCAARFDAAGELVRSDLTKLVSDLQKAGLIRPCGKRAGCIAPVILINGAAALIGAVMKSRRFRISTLLTFFFFGIRILGLPILILACRDYSEKHRRRGTSEQSLDAIDEAVRNSAAGHLLGISCKERALTSWALTVDCDLPSRLIFGIQLFPFSAHCWLSIGSRTIGDAADRSDQFTPVLTFN
jgi:hypothetical protein